MSESTVESPLALYSAKTWVGVLSYCFMICFLGTECHRWLEHSQLFMIFQSSCTGLKSRESPRHSKTDVSLISRMCFADLGPI